MKTNEELEELPVSQMRAIKAELSNLYGFDSLNALLVEWEQCSRIGMR
jgi:hypothetical protein